MNIIFVSVENGITAVGFRKMASVARSLHSDTKVCYIAPQNAFSIKKLLTKFNKNDSEDDISKSGMKSIATYLGQADLLCFSSMTNHADLTKNIIQAVRLVNPKTFILWGGIHPIIHPEDAILSADAICVGEGETAYAQFLTAFKKGEDHTNIKNFWFNSQGKIIRNKFLPLHTPDELENFPLPLYAENELIFKEGKGFTELTEADYIAYNGLGYLTIWSIGCPFNCTYCSNTKFIENDSSYRKLRYPSVSYIIREVQHVVRKHPHVSTIKIGDDGFMSISVRVLKAFADQWKEKIKLPFFVGGVTPISVRQDKMKILTEGGMIQLRMGIQSGSNRMLDFYKRPNKQNRIENATKIIAEFLGQMMPPWYDIIVDNPIESKEDVEKTLELLYDLPRPYFINIFSLRIIPNTELAREFEKAGVYHYDLKKHYKITAPTFANVSIFMIQLFRPPKFMFNFMLKHAKPFREEQKSHYFLLHVFRTLWVIKIGFYYFLYMEFALIPGRIGWLLWKTKIMKFYQKIIVKRFLIKEVGHSD